MTESAPPSMGTAHQQADDADTIHAAGKTRAGGQQFGRSAR